MIVLKDFCSVWCKIDIMWMLGFYGMVIGVGVLFLLINVGVGGMILLIIMVIFVFLMMFFVYCGLICFVLFGKNLGEDIIEVVEEYFGIGVGKLIILFYFFVIYSILLVYSVVIINIVESFMFY